MTYGKTEEPKAFITLLVFIVIEELRPSPSGMYTTNLNWVVCRISEPSTAAMYLSLHHPTQIQEAVIPPSNDPSTPFNQLSQNEFSKKDPLNGGEVVISWR